MRKKTNTTRSQNSDKQNIKHFRPVNVLPISGKTSERPFLKKCLDFLSIIILFQNSSRVSKLMFHVSTN